MADNTQSCEHASSLVSEKPAASIYDALIIFERDRELAALLAYAASTIKLDFTAQGGQPRLLLETADGLVRPADVDVVLDAATTISRLAREARERASSLLERPIEIAGVGEGAQSSSRDAGRLRDILTLRAVGNPRKGEKKDSGSRKKVGC